MTTFCVLAILLEMREDLVQYAQGLDDVVHYFNLAATSWNIKKLCKKAVTYHRKYLYLRMARANAMSVYFT
ncbi:hypothetical protein CLOM_g14331 [Closterium sp. NIES-68]|nr:hypothetical protein CLOM_g14331 [Closterium sp. NIES-68]GJP61683.1 hypothetical protein CLOP_g18830 [Closterium sp. NIES-67]